MPDTDLLEVTDEQVDQSREKVIKLREQVAEERSKASALIRSGENAVRKAQLDAEGTRLEQELKSLRESNKSDAVQQAVADQVEAVTSEPGGASAEVVTPATEEG